MSQNKKTGLFPGSFDPFTKGHQDVVEQALTLFDEIIIGIGVNETKKYLFDLEKRKQHIASIFAHYPQVSVREYKGLTVDFAKACNAQFLIRGLRDSRDFSYERAIAHMNDQMGQVKSVFLLTKPEFGAINSTIVREIYKNGAKIDDFVTNVHFLV